MTFDFPSPSLLLLFLFYSACTSRPAPPPRSAFYHWQTELRLTPQERVYLDELGADRLYVKFFDVDWDEGRRMAVPLAEVQIDTARLGGLEIIPTVFITNRSLQPLEGAAIDTLGVRIARKIDQLAVQPPREIQFDCDWTATTRERYFQLLAVVQSQLSDDQILSVTIRLHQLRYPDRTGVPPADRGMLMCYNVGDLDHWAEENSILTPAGARPYFEGASTYPLPLDLALPVFRWGIVFRNGQLVRLINELGPEALADTSRFDKLTANRFLVTKSTYLDGYYLYQGDRIRTEAIDPATLRQTVELARRQFDRPGTLAWYHLDTTTIKRYPHAILEAIYEQL